MVHAGDAGAPAAQTQGHPDGPARQASPIAHAELLRTQRRLEVVGRPLLLGSSIEPLGTSVLFSPGLNRRRVFCSTFEIELIDLPFLHYTVNFLLRTPRR